VNARAFTTGNSVFFGKGEYAPESTKGRSLLAHELAHIIQQNGSGRVSDQSIQRTIGDGHDLSSPCFTGDLKLEACYDDEARLTKGATGESVKKVQKALIDLGYYLGPPGADGIYGDFTWNAVRQFKKNEQLGWESMGDVGPGTMRRLDEVCGKGHPVDIWPTDHDHDRDGCFQDLIPFPGTRKPGKKGRGYNPFAHGCYPESSHADCNEDTGLYKIVNNNHCCSRDCTQQHEELHATDLGDCCFRYKEALAVSHDPKVRQKWKKWIDKNGPTRRWTECRGYTLDIACAEAWLIQHSPPTEIDMRCWEEFQRYLKLALREKGKWCKGAPSTRPACPFNP
jgi:hypothetical protein